MHSGVAASAPAPAQLQVRRVINSSDEDALLSGEVTLLLGVALQTEIVVAFNQQLGIDGTMRTVADRAPLSHGFVLEHERA